MNNSFVQRQADRLAARLEQQSHSTEEALQGMSERVWGRGLSRNEETRFLEAVKDRGLRSVCWAVLNSTEFLYVQ